MNNDKNDEDDKQVNNNKLMAVMMTSNNRLQENIHIDVPQFALWMGIGSGIEMDPYGYVVEAQGAYMIVDSGNFNWACSCSKELVLN